MLREKNPRRRHFERTEKKGRGSGEREEQDGCREGGGEMQA